MKLLSVKGNVGIDKLKRMIKKEFGRRMNIQVKDNDGDLISVKSDKDLLNVFRHTKPPIRFVYFLFIFLFFLFFEFNFILYLFLFIILFIFICLF